MYGWIIVCMRDWVLHSFGEETWQLIVEKTGCENSAGWLKDNIYPDSATFDIVSAATDILGYEKEELFDRYGKYFLTYVVENGYENLLYCLGSNLREWLSNVNMLHRHLSLTLPQIAAPEFWCYDDEGKEAIILEYKSVRGAGLEGMVTGMVRESAAKFFHLDITMESLTTQDIAGAEFSSWRIRECGSIASALPRPLMTSPENMSEATKSALEATQGKCPFQHRHRSRAAADSDSGECPEDPANVCPVDVCPVNVCPVNVCPVRGQGVPPENDISAEVHSPFMSTVETSEARRRSHSHMGAGKRERSNRLNSRNHEYSFTSQQCDYGLSGKQLCTLFPFHIVFNRELIILQCGFELQPFLNTDIVGEKLSDVFRVNRPFTFDDWGDFVSKIKSDNLFLECTLEQTHAPLELTGTAICDDEDIVTVLCSPNIRNLAGMKGQGLTMNDIPKTDCRLEMILTTEHLQSETNAVARMTDMSAQLQNEMQARMRLMQQAAENAENSLATKRAFVRYVSHEIRTPLSVSMLGLDLIAEEAKALGGGEGHRTNISACQESINIAVGILNDLLSYEKLESGILALQKEYIPLTSFINDCLSPFFLQARQKEVSFTVEDETREDSQNPLFIHIDRTKMSQVIRNLSSNAIKFTPPGGIVRVVISTHSDAAPTEDKDTGPFTYTSSSGDEHPLRRCGGLVLSFIDSGVGISTSNQRRVFKEVVQFSPNELQAGGGSGLGLWISRGIVDLHKGAIGMKSEGVGMGSTFFVELSMFEFDDQEIVSPACESNSVTGGQSRDVLPCKRPLLQSSSTVEEEVDYSVLRGLRALVVDDAAMIRKFLQRVLMAKGAICSLAENGQHAIDTVQQLQRGGGGVEVASEFAGEAQEIYPPSGQTELLAYDVILVDFIMPVLDGPSTTKILRDNGYKGLIIGVTGNMMPPDIDTFMQAGASSVFAKPLEMKKLVRYLCAHLN